MENLRVKGNQEFMGINIPVIEGGFGEEKKCICDKTIAEIHGQVEREIRRRINDNIKRFKESIDFIDLKKGVGDSHTLELLQKLGYAKQSITQAAHIYLLSERGYAKLIKIMDTDLAWEIHDKLIDEYFAMREVINSDEQMKAKLLLAIYNGGQEGILASKELTEIEVEAATKPLLKTIGKQNKAIEQKDKQLQTQKPFVQFALKIQNSDGVVDMKTTAKWLADDGIKIGRNRLMDLLRKNKVLMGDNTPYQKYIELGLFKVKISTKETHWGVKMNPVTLVTGKGLIFINKKLREWLGMESLDIEI